MAEAARRLPRVAAAPAAPRRRSVAMRLVSNQRVVAGSIVLLLSLALALLAGVVAPFDPNAQVLADRLAPPSAAHPFGVDQLGRDVLSRVIYGSRVSLGVGFSSVAITIVIGTVIGVAAGFFGRRAGHVALAFLVGLISRPGVLSL